LGPISGLVQTNLSPQLVTLLVIFAIPPAVALPFPAHQDRTTASNARFSCPIQQRAARWSAWGLRSPCPAREQVRLRQPAAASPSPNPSPRAPAPAVLSREPARDGGTQCNKSGRSLGLPLFLQGRTGTTGMHCVDAPQGFLCRPSPRSPTGTLSAGPHLGRVGRVPVLAHSADIILHLSAPHSHFITLPLSILQVIALSPPYTSRWLPTITGIEEGLRSPAATPITTIHITARSREGQTYSPIHL
jgi:hypothetical protein